MRPRPVVALLPPSPPRRSPLCLVNCRACSGITVRSGGPLAEACVDVCPGFSLVGYFGPATLSCSDARRTLREGRERSRAEAVADCRDRPVSLRLPGALPALLCRTGFQPAA